MTATLIDEKTISGAFFADFIKRFGHERSVRQFALAYRYLTRCVSEDMIELDKIELMDSYDADYFACQMAHGDTQLLFGLSGNKDAMLTLASRLAYEEFDSINEDSYDALCEFTNVVNGGYVVMMEEDDEQMDMSSPVCCENCHIKTNGQFCVMTLKLNQKELQVISIIDIIPFLS